MRRKLKRKKIEAAVAEYLSTRHYTLWADWDISRTDSRDKAIEWGTAFVSDVLERMK